MYDNINVSAESAKLYKKRSGHMLEKINAIMTEKSSRLNLIGSNPLSVMYNNHDNHAMFVSNLLLLNDYTMLRKTVAWVLSSYMSKGFAKEYFGIFLNTWIEVLEQELPENNSKEIRKVYELMISLTDDDSLREQIGGAVKNTFVDTLVSHMVAGNHLLAMNLLKEVAVDKKSLMNAYVTIIQPAMYEVGNMWERNEITVSHEHLATSIIMRVMSTFYEDFVLGDPYKYKVVIAAAMNEFHEIGARIVADFLEMGGYDVRYLGSNMPSAELIKLLIAENPAVLGLSVSMSYNIDKIIDAVRDIRLVEELDNMKIIVGGNAFAFVDKENLAGMVDFVADDAYGALKVCEEWWNEGFGHEM
ncbi:MAG: cobalamin-dependent protein [Clostridia bacterium]